MKKGKMVLIAAGALLLGACQEKNAEIQDSRVMPGPVLSEETRAVMSGDAAGNADASDQESAQEKSWQQIYLEYFEKKQKEME